MAEIHITTIDANHYQVQLVSSTTTSHNVTVWPDYAQKFTAGTMSTVDLIHQSFEFYWPVKPTLVFYVALI